MSSYSTEKTLATIVYTNNIKELSVELRNRKVHMPAPYSLTKIAILMQVCLLPIVYLCLIKRVHNCLTWGVVVVQWSRKFSYSKTNIFFFEYIGFNTKLHKIATIGDDDGKTKLPHNKSNREIATQLFYYYYVH